MSKIRVYELAKELGIENKDLITRLEKLGIAVKAHSSSLEEDDVQRVRTEFALGEKDAIVEERVKRTVIRRRAVRQPTPEGEEEIPAESQPEPEGALEEAEEKETVQEAVPAEGEKEEKKEEKKAVPEKKPRRTSATIVRAAIRKEPEIIPPEEKVVPPREEVSVPPQETKPAPEKETKAPPKPSHKMKKPVEVHVGEDVRKKKTFLKQQFDKKGKRTRRGKSQEARRSWKEEKVVSATRIKATEITTPKAIKRRIRIEEVIKISDLARKMGIKAGELISKLVSLGMMVTINQSIDIDAATLVAGEFGYQVEA
ncbi:MAG: translation initiation factor IF-2 N-terminal domain-containing protein, partial [Deltaproteobacteria bacterium]|nr:translation initiation factor IF-2 N-terminal domain-containing protein [Deltaproteobacteria bacterium]